MWNALRNVIVMAIRSRNTPSDDSIVQRRETRSDKTTVCVNTAMNKNK